MLTLHDEFKSTESTVKKYLSSHYRLISRNSTASLLSVNLSSPLITSVSVTTTSTVFFWACSRFVVYIVVRALARFPDYQYYRAARITDGPHTKRRVIKVRDASSRDSKEIRGWWTARNRTRQAGNAITRLSCQSPDDYANDDIRTALHTTRQRLRNCWLSDFGADERAADFCNRLDDKRYEKEKQLQLFVESYTYTYVTYVYIVMKYNRIEMLHM